MSQQYPGNGGYMAPSSPPQEQPKRIGAITMVAMVVLVFAILVILNETMLTVRNVEIIGNEKISSLDVAKAAGLDHPVSFFTVDAQAVVRNLQSNHYLVFERLEKVFPNSLKLYVHERKPIARVQEMGVEYVLDEEGMVLDRNMHTAEHDDYESLMFITGLKPKEMRIGQMTQAGTSTQLEIYRALIREVMLQGITSEIAELNVTDPENLYLITTDQYTAHLGNVEDLRPKIGTVRAVIAYLRQGGYQGGMLEANIPGEAVFSPLTP